jgi:glycosyltransferase involved in cell wall biosynthesis
MFHCRHDDLTRVSSPKRPKVLFLATVFRHLASFHIPFMLMLNDMGCEVHAAASFDGHESTVKSAGVICWDISFARSSYSLRNVKASLQLKNLFDNIRYDLIHVHTPVAAFLGRCIARRTGQGSVLYTAHGFHFYEGAPLHNWLAYYSAEKLAARRTDGLVVMNQEDLYSAEKRLGFIRGHNLFFVHGVGVDINHFCSTSLGFQDSFCTVRNALHLSQKDILVACIGELSRRKNQAFLLKSWKAIASKRSNAHLLLVGDGPLSNVLQKMVERQNIRNVHFIGFKTNIQKILDEVDVVALVSKQEGLPRAIMEAMAVSRPVVATNIRGNIDLVRNGVNGLLVDIGDVQGLESALLALIDDYHLRTSMGSAGRAMIQPYSMESVLDEMRQIYIRFLTQRSN